MFENTKKKNKKYFLSAYVKDTTKANGPGHVSVSAIKKQQNEYPGDKENLGQNKVYHTSFFPGMVGSVVNGLSLGSIPVDGKVETDPKEDIEQADHCLIKEVDKAAYKKFREAQESFNEDVRSGHRLYSVFGPKNLVASAVTGLVNGHKGASLIARAHRETHKFHVPEDLCGIHVYDESMHTLHASDIKYSTVDNCSSSVTHVVQASGIPIKNRYIPTFFTEELQKHGFTNVTKEEVRSKFGTP